MNVVPDLVRSFQLGDMTVTILSEGTLKVPPGRVFAGIDEAAWKPLVEMDATGCFPIGMNLVHVATGGHSILIDAGLGEPQPPRLTFDRDWSVAQTARVDACLASMGIPPEQITSVLLSHAHNDHIMGTTLARDGRRVPTYPNARYLMMRKEWEEDPRRLEPDSAFNLHLPVLREHDCLDLVEDGHEVAPGVRMIFAPGESPGHALVRLQSQGKTAFFLGDLFHHRTEVLHPDWVWPRRNKAQLMASRQALAKEALETDALLLTAHMLFPGTGKLRRSPEGLEWVALEP